MDISVKQLVNQGLLAHQNGQYAEAENCYRAALARYPASAEVTNYLGLLLSLLGRLGEAEECFEVSVKNEPDNTDYRFNWAVTLQSQGKLKLAAENYVAVLEKNPNHRQSIYNLSVAYQGSGVLDVAIEGYRRVIALDPSDARPFFNLGTALRTFGKPAEAIPYFKDALRLLPEYPEAYNNLGVAWLEVGENDRAFIAFHKALLQKPDYAEAYYNVHALYLDSGDINSAIRSLENATRLRGTESKYHFFLGVLFQYVGRDDEAKLHFAEISRLCDPIWLANLDAWAELSPNIIDRQILIGSGLKIFSAASLLAPRTGVILEFGVRFGTSIRILSDLNSERTLNGFDSFEGLPEIWHDEPKGSYSTKGVLPTVPSNVTLHQGWFDKTLPKYLSACDQPIAIVNIDCDIYSSTKIVLDLLTPRIVEGTILIFDELVGNQHWREDEFKAFQEWSATNKFKYKYLAVSFYTKQAVIQILSKSVNS